MDKEKKEKKEKKDKEEKDKKEKKDKDEKKEKKEKKERREGGGLDLWASTGDSAAANPYGGPKAPADKRQQELAREKEIKKDAETKNLIQVSDVISQTLNKQKEAKREETRKQAETKAKAMKAARREQEVKDEEGDSYQILDNKGLGNFMDKIEVMEIMKDTVKTATSQGGSRCQVSSRTVMGDKLYTNQNTQFESLGDMKAVKGFLYLRGPKEEQGVKITLLRPATVYVALSKPPNEDDPFLRTWQTVDETDCAPPEFADTVAPIHEVKRKVYKDPDNRHVEVPRPPPGLETCLVFVVPDFHADVFGEEQLSEEEMREKERQEAAARRAGKSSSSTAKEAPSKADELEAILKKAEAGEKLSNKEKRALDRHNEKNVQYKNEDDEPVGGLHAFTIALEGGKNEPPPSGDAFVCNNFTLSAPKQTLFDNASVTIVQGHRYGILGPNGQGKTTLLRHIAAREMPVPVNWDVILVEQEAKATDRSAVEEVLAADLRAADLIKREAELLQKLEDIETAMEKGEDISAEEVERTRLDLENTSAELEAIGADSAEARVRKILCGLGFTNGPPDEDRFSMDRPVVQFSGGWRMRISLAKALFLQPKLLMLDEPTNHLDLDAVLWLDNYLSEQYPHAVVVVSHDADFLDSICTDILHLEDKKLVHYRGDYTAFKKMHLQKKATSDKEFKKQQDELKALKRKGKTKEEAEALVKEKFRIDSLDEKQKDYIVKFKFEGHGMDRTLGLNVSEVAFSYDGKEPWLLEEVEIGVDCGSRIAIVGPNGAGKSTILNLMMQHLEPCQGEVSASKGIRIRQYHQHFEELLPLDKTGVEYLTDAFNLGPPEKARAVLGQFGLPGGSHFTKIGNLSGGQKARVAFAALMLMKPHIIILDEPTNHLDIESVEALTTAITNFNGGLVLVSHDARLITEVDCELWVCEDGGCYRFEKDFDGYRDKVLNQLDERQAEVERMEQKRRELRAHKRAKHLSDEQLQAAKKRKQTELAQKATQAQQEQGKQEKQEKQEKIQAVEEAKDKEKDEQDSEEEQSPAEEERDDKDAGEDGTAEEQKSEDESEANEAKDKEKDEQDSEEEQSPAEEEKDDKDAGEDGTVEAGQDEETAPEEGATHSQYIVAKVKTVDAMKKKKGMFLVELETGGEPATVVTSYDNLEPGQSVVLAPEGSEVMGKEVKKQKVAGEWAAGVICGPMEMGLSGDASKALVLTKAYKVGAAAPANGGLGTCPETSPSPVGDVKPEKEEGQDESAASKGNKKKAPAKREASHQEAENKPETAATNEEETKEEAKHLADKKKGKMSKEGQRKADIQQAKTEEKNAKDEEVPAAKEAAAGKHSEYIVAKVQSAEPMKKKKGMFLVELETGGEPATVVTSYENLEAGQSVILAPVGSSVLGKEVKGQKVAGEWTTGVICGPMEMGLGGDASKALVLTKGYKVGAAAPADGGSGLSARDGATVRGKEGKEAKPHKKKQNTEDDEAPVAKEEQNTADKESPIAEEQHAGDDEGSASKEANGDGKHSEYIVAKVQSVEPMKKKKGMFLVELETGGEPATVVTSYENLEAGQSVVLAPEGSDVMGKEVKRQKVAGEWAAGVICGPMEMGLSGDASKALVLTKAYKVGSAAPADGV